MQRWLITGATGLLGSNLGVTLGSDPGTTVIAVARSLPSSIPAEALSVDIRDPAQIDRLVAATAADVVVNCAAMASHEACESRPEEASRVNALAARELAAQAAVEGVPFVQISTDAVFEGSVGGMFSERDTPVAHSQYARSKLLGEQLVLEANPEALVMRVNFYGWSPTGTRSLAEFFLNRLAAGRTVTGFTDVRVSSLYVGYLARTLIDLVRRGTGGLMHVVSSEATSKFDLGRQLAATFHLDPNLVIPARSRDILSVPRGQDLSLDTRRVATLLGQSMPGQEDGARQMLRDRVSTRERVRLWGHTAEGGVQ